MTFIRGRAVEVPVFVPPVNTVTGDGKVTGVQIDVHERLAGAAGSGLPTSGAIRYVERGTIEDELWQALQARQKRAVVGVGGMGGVGKTELAL